MTIKPEDLNRDQLEKILNKWGKPSKLAQIKQNPLIFYDKEGIKRSKKTTTLAPFISQGLENGVKNWDLQKFKKYTKIAAEMLRASTNNINVLRKTFTDFKNVYRKHHSDDDERYASLQNTLSLTPDESQTWIEQSKTNVKKKTETQVKLTKKTIENFINAVIFNLNPDVIDKIIACQITSGARLIEILSRKVSKFIAAPNEPDMIRQIGIAKTKGVDPNRVVVKPLLAITPEKFINNIRDITKAIGNIDNVSNNTLGKRWNARINMRIKQYWDKLGVKLSQSDLKEVGNSHGMRRLYINYAYANRKNKNMSKQLFISRYLGHKDEISAAAANYDSVNVEKNQPEEKKQVESKPIAISEKQKKFAKIERLIKEGKTTYADLQNAGITTYTYSQYKKSKGLQTERPAPSKSVAEVVAELKKDGKKPTYANLRAAGGFTNKQIKDYKDNQK